MCSGILSPIDQSQVEWFQFYLKENVQWTLIAFLDSIAFLPPPLLDVRNEPTVMNPFVFIASTEAPFVYSVTLDQCDQQLTAAVENRRTSTRFSRSMTLVKSQLCFCWLFHVYSFRQRSQWVYNLHWQVQEPKKRGHRRLRALRSSRLLSSFNCWKEKNI